MDIALRSLIAYIKNSDLITNVEKYAGQIKMNKNEYKIAEVSGKLPSCLIVLGKCEPIAVPAKFSFELFVITESAAFKQEANMDANIELVTDLIEYIKSNNTFEETIEPELKETNGMNYQIMNETLSVEPFSIDNKYAIYLVHIDIEGL